MFPSGNPEAQARRGLPEECQLTDKAGAFGRAVGPQKNPACNGLGSRAAPAWGSQWCLVIPVPVRVSPVHHGAGHGHPAVTPSLGLRDRESPGRLGAPLGRFPGGRRCYLGRVKQEGEGCRGKFKEPPAGPPPARAENNPRRTGGRAGAGSTHGTRAGACLGWVLQPLPPSLGCCSHMLFVFPKSFRMVLGAGSSLAARARARVCALTWVWRQELRSGLSRASVSPRSRFRPAGPGSWLP